MSELEIAGTIGTNVVRRLRENKLRNGQPFLISVAGLPANQHYMEFPDGSIKLIAIQPTSRDYRILRELTKAESTRLHQRFHL